MFENQNLDNQNLQPENTYPRPEIKPEIKPEQNTAGPQPWNEPQNQHNQPQQPSNQPPIATNPIFSGQQDTMKDVNDLFNTRFAAPKQDFEPPKQEPIKPAGEQAAGNQPPEEDPSRRAEKMGKLFFLMFDRPLILGASLVSGRDKDAFKVSPEDKKELIEAWAEMADAYDWKKPPAWLVIVIFMGVVYGNIYWEAFKIRSGDQKKNKTKLKETADQLYNRAGRPVQSEAGIFNQAGNQQAAASNRPFIEDAELAEDAIFSKEDFFIRSKEGGRPSKADEQLEKLYKKIAKEHPELLKK